MTDFVIITKEIEKNLQMSRWLSPVNLAEEREKFLKNPNHSPQIIYPKFDAEPLQAFQNQLSGYDLPDSETLADWILHRKVEQLKLEISLLQSMNTEEFGRISCQLYQCHFDEKSLAEAKIDAQLDATFETRENKTVAEIVDGIKKYLQNYGISDWSVEVAAETDFYFRVKAAQKRILISQRFNWDFSDFDNMLAHEIDGHILRAVNATQQENELLRKPLPFYIKTEEGLGSFLGDYCSTTAEVSRKHHALKYLAGHLAMKSSFIEVFEFLVESGFTPDLAFQRTFRLKRGLSDTGQPGCFAKEAMYYEGMLEVKKHLDQGGSVEKLYAGKVGLDDLRFIEPSAREIIPHRLKTYLSQIEK